MRQLRALVAICLALTVILTSGAMAVARGDARAGVGTMVLCTGYGPKSVAVDSDGQPVGPTHFCPDCALAAFFMPCADAPSPALRVIEGRLFALPHIAASCAVETADPSARGPPAAA